MKVDIFLKGILMGICDLVPGISGGTIAFVTGIYERLINSLNSLFSFEAIIKILISSTFIFYPSKKNMKNLNKVYLRYDLYFLLNLISGILLAIFLGAWFISYLLENYFVLTMSFFVGLILSSCFLIYKKIKSHKVIDRYFGFVGFLFGCLLIFLVPANIEISFLYLFFSGFIGISAMFLPGISGSYILYILGSYEFVINALKSPIKSYFVLFVFLMGVIIGAIFISKIIYFMLKNFHSKTLYFLFGFVMGALFIPLRDIFLSGIYGINIFLSILLFLIGLLVVLIISEIGNSKVL